MTYGDFYKIANYLNDCNNNIFSNEEVACNACDYMQEIDMISLCTELVEDMDCHDYDDIDNIIDLYTIEKIFEEFLENY